MIKLTILKTLIQLCLIFIISSLNSFGSSTISKNDTLFRKFPGHVNQEGAYQPEQAKVFELIHTRLDIQPDWKTQQLIGTAYILVKPHFYEQSEIVLDAKGFDIKEIGLLNKTPNYTSAFASELSKINTQKLKYDYDKQQLTIHLAKKYSRKDTLLLKIGYIANPNDVVPAYSTEKGLYFINADNKTPGKPKQLWTQGETRGSSCWFPTLDSPNQKFTQDIHLTVDSSYKTLSNGLLISQKMNANGSRTDHWKQKLPHAPYLAMIAVGDFSITKQLMPDGLELSYYVEPKYKKDASAIFGRTADMMAFFTNIFGIKYPWEKYAQITVRDFVSGAMENTTATVHAEDVQTDTRSLIDGNSDAVIAHELAHHWFGNYVTAESWGQLPLNESFANYSEYLWDEYNKGRLEADLGNQHELTSYLTESETKQVPMIRYFFKHPDDMFDSHSYAKGGRILHMLRKYVGDEAFFTSLQEYLKKNAFGTAEIDELRIAFEKVSGEDLNWFFDQWFHNSGHPILAVKQTYVADLKKVILYVEQIQDIQKSTLYRLPLEVAIWIDGKKQIFPIVLNKRQQSFEFPINKEPDFLLLDGKSQLLGIIEHEKSTKVMASQFQYATDFQPKYEALMFMQDKINEPLAYNTLFKAMDESFWKFRQTALSTLNGYEGKNLNDLSTKIQKIASSDPHPQVRAEALLTLSSFKNKLYTSIYRDALKDSSYMVAAIALEKYLSTNPTDGTTIALQFENASNDQLVTSVANYYADLAQPQRFDWFVEKMRPMKVPDKFNYLQVFGKYLIKSDQIVQMRGIPVLEDIARNDPSYYIRFAAFQVLGFLNDIPVVNDIQQDIKSKEKEPKLIELYKQL